MFKLCIFPINSFILTKLKMVLLHRESETVCGRPKKESYEKNVLDNIKKMNTLHFKLMQQMRVVPSKQGGKT